MKRHSRFARVGYRWLEQLSDPRRVLKGIASYPWFWSEWRRYSRLPGAEKLRMRESYPQLHDRHAFTPIDSHYFYSNGWAMRRVVQRNPRRHVDIGSQTIFANLLAAVVPVAFLDYRPLAGRIAGVDRVGADILALPLRSGSVDSLSCLHVAEHIGLGRYGDPLDVRGTIKACDELARALRPGGDLFFAIPVGRERVCFNAHRVHAPATIRRYFEALELVEFSIVTDSGELREHVPLDEFADSDYACGLFWFRRPQPA